MSLSCTCDFEPDEYSWWWEDHTAIKPMARFSRRKKCTSCGSLINDGEDVFEFPRYRAARTDIEEDIHGDTVKLAPHYTCETCSGLIEAVESAGMCFALNASIAEQIAYYREAETEYKKYLKEHPNDDNQTIDDFT